MRHAILGTSSNRLVCELYDLYRVSYDFDNYEEGSIGEQSIVIGVKVQLVLSNSF